MTFEPVPGIKDFAPRPAVLEGQIVGERKPRELAVVFDADMLRMLDERAELVKRLAAEGGTERRPFSIRMVLESRIATADANIASLAVLARRRAEQEGR